MGDGPQSRSGSVPGTTSSARFVGLVGQKKRSLTESLAGWCGKSTSLWASGMHVKDGNTKGPPANQMGGQDDSWPSKEFLRIKGKGLSEGKS